MAVMTPSGQCNVSVSPPLAVAHAMFGDGTGGVGVAAGAGGVGVAVGSREPPLQPFSTLFTAWTMSATVTAAPWGMPCGHAKGRALPTAMFTIVMSSSTVTLPLASQSPEQRA